MISYLGVKVDQDLKWRLHSDYIYDNTHETANLLKSYCRGDWTLKLKVLKYIHLQGDESTVLYAAGIESLLPLQLKLDAELDLYDLKNSQVIEISGGIFQHSEMEQYNQIQDNPRRNAANTQTKGEQRKINEKVGAEFVYKSSVKINEKQIAGQLNRYSSGSLDSKIGN